MFTQLSATTTDRRGRRVGVPPEPMEISSIEKEVIKKTPPSLLYYPHRIVDLPGLGSRLKAPNRKNLLTPTSLLRTLFVSCVHVHWVAEV